MAISVYGKLTNPASFTRTFSDETGIKDVCTPFVNKALDELAKLPKNMSEYQCRTAANTFLSGMQTLYQGGILPEDYDKIDFVKRGMTVVPSARVEAFYRAAARKGYRMSDTIVAVSKEDAAGTYFEEHFHNGQIIFVLKDSRKNTDRKITAERIAKGYFDRYLIRLTVHDIATNVQVASVLAELYNSELIAISNSSDQGIFKAKWVDGYGGKKTRQVSEELNTIGFWYKWTNPMVQKTMVKQALRRVRETLPALKDTIYAFEQDDEVPETTPLQQQPVIEVPVVEKQERNVDFKNLTDNQKQECRELQAVYKANPIMRMDDALEIEQLVQSGTDKADIINERFAQIFCLKLSKSAWEIIDPYFGGYFE